MLDVLLLQHKVASPQHRPVRLDVLRVHELAELGDGLKMEFAKK